MIRRESADKAIANPAGGFELLIASSQDIAASTIQLVVASQVRADRSSQNLTLLKQASTGVKTATAGVVATAKDCTQLIEESGKNQQRTSFRESYYVENRFFMNSLMFKLLENLVCVVT